MDHPIVFVDLETGGTDENIHQITQIAAVATRPFPDLEIIAQFECKVELVEGHYEQEALDVQNYDETVWFTDAVPAKKAISWLSEFCREYTHSRISGRTGKPYRVAHLAGYNVGFDSDFLRATAERLRMWVPLTNWTGGYFDVLHLAKWALALGGEMVTQSLKLADVCALFEIELEAHDAMNDVRATVELCKRLFTNIPEERMPFTAGSFGP